MANPADITFQDNFESGDSTGWSGGDTDTGGYMDIVHYSTLAGIPGMPMPYSGAYCSRWLLGSSTAAAIYTEADIDLGTSFVSWVKFNIWIDPDFQTNTTADDNIVLFEGTATAAEVFAFGIDYTLTGDSLVWAIGTHASTATPDTDSTEKVKLGVWHTVELELAVITGSAAGYMSAYITEDGQEPSETPTITKTGIQNAAITEGKLGVQSPKTSSNGIILMDGFQYSGATAATGARIYPTKNRYSTVRQFVRAGQQKDAQGFHAFVGAGRVTNVTWNTSVSGTVDGLLAIYDTDTAKNHMGNRKAAYQMSVQAETIDVPAVPFDVTRGCYVEIDSPSQETHEVILTIDRAPNWFSDGNMKRFASRRNLSG
jgi:hypothetical protein